MIWITRTSDDMAKSEKTTECAMGRRIRLMKLAFFVTFYTSMRLRFAV
jgi:hypothetical protein